ncbi:MAG: hypothetical protein V1722_00325 [Candidatus Micrarchaeota archaeon]
MAKKIAKLSTMAEQLEKPWHLKAAESLGRSVTPLFSGKGKLKGHVATSPAFAPYSISFVVDSRHPKAQVVKIINGRSKRAYVSIYPDGRFGSLAQGTLGIRTLAEFTRAAPKSKLLRDVPQLIAAARAANKALKQHAPK